MNMFPVELRRAVRSLRRTPSFTVPLVATMAIATAIVTATFAIVYGAWQRHFGGRRDVIGRSVLVDGTRRTVSAVMPAAFAFPDDTFEMWAPLVLPPASYADDQRGNENMRMIARLAPGATERSAQ